MQIASRQIVWKEGGRGTVVEVTFRYLDDKDYDDDWNIVN